MFPLMGLLNRMIFWELLKVFLLSLVGLTGLFLVGGIVQQASQLGLSPGQVIEVIPLLIPSMLPFTIPATTLFASCVVYGRVSNDNEAVAMKAAGLDLLNILRPALLLGLITACVTGGLYYSIIPRSQQMLGAKILEDPEALLYNRLKREKRLGNHNSIYVVFVKDVQGRRLIDVVVKRRSGVVDLPGVGAASRYDFVARAREARLIVDMDARKLVIDADRWVVADGQSNLVSDAPRPEAIELPEELTGKNIKMKPITLEWIELDERLVELEKGKQETRAKRAANLKSAETESDPTVRLQILSQDNSFEEQLKEFDRQTRNVGYEYQIRPALAVGCLCFAVLGCPIGIWANRSDYLSTFVTCFLPTVFIYYPLLLSGGGLARDGKVPMVVGVWIADVLAALAAVILAWRLIKR